MSPEQVKVMAQNSLRALNDERVMIPTPYVNAIADLKSVLMGMMSGQLVIDNAKAPDVALQPSTNGETEGAGEQPST